MTVRTAFISRPFGNPGLRNCGHLRSEGGEGHCSGPEVRHFPHIYPDERDVCSDKSIYSISAAGIDQPQINAINSKKIASGEVYHPYYGISRKISALSKRSGTELLRPSASRTRPKSIRMVNFTGKPHLMPSFYIKKQADVSVCLLLAENWA